MLAIPKAARSFSLPLAACRLPLAVCAALLLAGEAAQAVSVAPERQKGVAATEAAVLLVHVLPQGKRSWQRPGKHKWRRDHRGRQLHRKFRSRHFSHRRYGPRRKVCHPVRRLGFHHGYKVLLGAVLCHDRHGRAYVQRGSRRILRYLHH